jgi:Photosynthetic reaction centre protein/GIY-YIG catalytic domain
MRPWIAVAYSAPVAAATAVFIIYPIGQGSFSDGMPLGISGTFNFMIVFQAEHNILMHPFHMLGEINASPSVQRLIYFYFNILEQPKISFTDNFLFLHLSALLIFLTVLAPTGRKKNKKINLETFLDFCIIQNSENDKRGIETRLNGGNPKSFALYPLLKILNSNHSIMNELIFKISSGDTNDSTQGNPVPIRMSPRQLPGVYMVLCLVNNKRYYGESKNVSSRLSQHKSRLRRNIHEIPELQRDFNLYGEENFEFSCLYISKDLSLEKRKALETELIGRFYDLCYNKSDRINHERENNPFWNHTHSNETRKQIAKSVTEHRKNAVLEGFAILLNGEVFPSLSEASRQTGHSRDTIRRWLNDANNLNCVPMDASKPRETGNTNAESVGDLLDPLEVLDPNSAALVVNTGFNKEVSIYGVTYSSIAEAARQRNCSRSNIQRLLRNHPQDCYITKI